MQPRITQVPPNWYSSAIATRLPAIAAMRLARTPPEPPPITNRSKSNSAIGFPFDDFHVLRRVRDEKRGGKSDKQPVLHHADDCLQRRGECGGIADAAERAVVDHIAAIGFERHAILGTQRNGVGPVSEPGEAICDISRRQG